MSGFPPPHPRNVLSFPFERTGVIVKEANAELNCGLTVTRLVPNGNHLDSNTSLLEWPLAFRQMYVPNCGFSLILSRVSFK